MKRALVVMAVSVLLGAHAAAAAPLVLRGGSALWLQGDSTLHAYSSTATKLGLDAEAAGSIGDALAGLRVERFTLRVPVAGLKSGEGLLDRNLRRALGVERHPDIVFTLESWEPAPLKVRGRLSVAGVERTIGLSAEAEAVGEDLRVRGSRELRMSEFGVKPPTFLRGAFKTDDRVRVSFDLRLGLERGQP